MAQAATSNCEICTGGPGEHYCQQCDQLFCGGCKLSHLRANISKNHTFLSGPNINKEERILCTEHEEGFLFYCHECDTPVCRMCSVKTHSRHLMTDLAETTEKLRSDLVKNIDSKITSSRQHISKIEKEIKTYHKVVKTVIKAITDEGNYWKQLIDKKIEALIKEVQNKEQREIQNMTAYSEVYSVVLANCQTWQNNIKQMETTTDLLKLNKLKQLKTNVDQIVLKKIPDAPLVSYSHKKPSDIDINNLFGELQFRDSEIITVQTDEQQIARDKEANFEQTIIEKFKRLLAEQKKYRYKCSLCRTEQISSRVPMTSYDYDNPFTVIKCNNSKCSRYSRHKYTEDA